MEHDNIELKILMHTGREAKTKSILMHSKDFIKELQLAKESSPMSNNSFGNRNN